MTSSAAPGAGAVGPQPSRHRGREVALQMLYQWEVGHVPVDEVAGAVLVQLEDEAAVGRPAQEFAKTLVSGTVGHLEEIDGHIRAVADNWRIERINTVDRLVLRMAIYEFLRQPETPARVIINEALELARSFSADESVRFVNGVLDGVRRRLERT